MLILAILFIGLSVILLSLGIYRLNGPVSVWFLTLSPYGAGGAYAPIPFGLCMLIWGFSFLPFVPEVWRLSLFFTGGTVAFLGLFIFPRVLKPSWLRWLEREHEAAIPFLRNEIQEMGYHNWDKQINTQQDLEEWVAEVRRKYRL